MSKLQEMDATVNLSKDDKSKAGKAKISPPILDFESSNSDEEKQVQRATERKLANFVSINNGLALTLKDPDKNKEDSLAQLDQQINDVTLDPTGIEALEKSRNY